MHATETRERGGTRCLSKAGLAEGTNANTIKTAAPNGAGTDYAIYGYAYHKADTDNIAMNALAVQAVATKCLYCIQADTGGTVTLVKGDEVLTADLSAGKTVLHWPLPAAGQCALGFLKVETDATHTFTSGTTDLSAAGITATFYDVMGIPTAGLQS
ncbi:MAG: hypothetical protein HY749_16315 [Gammaproteobacteria bacterium]|nr:hypothetical protein [Gammaproteobacteria bacterium]